MGAILVHEFTTLDGVIRPDVAQHDGRRAL
jgi:hypothetical protein